MSFKSHSYRHVAPDLTKFFNPLFNFKRLLKFLCLGSKSIQIIFFILNTLRVCSIRIQICTLRIQNTLGATSGGILCSYLLIQGGVNLLG
jgi:hypothetical protein